MNPVIKLLESSEILSRSTDFEAYLTKSAAYLAKWVRKEMQPKMQKGGVAYTFFKPGNQGFASGVWANCSPTVFWGFAAEEEERILFSCCLYYLIWPDVPPYTKVWNEKLSSIMPYNLQITIGEEVTNTVFLDKECQRIEIVLGIDSELKDSFSRYFEIFNNRNYGKQIKDKIRIDRIESDMFSFNFRALEEITDEGDKEFSEHSQAMRHVSGELKNLLVDELAEFKGKIEPELGLSFDESMDQLSKVLLKLLLIGPYPTKTLRLLNPKVYKNSHRHMGCFGGILRVYEDICPQELDRLYYLALPLISDISLRIASSYMYGFAQKHAFRSAIAAVIARNMSHNIGSHVEANIDRGEIKKRPFDMSVLNSYLQERMDFVARVSTEWSEWSEPIFFYSDLVQGFLNQGMILDYLVRDDGYKAKNIVFRIKTPGTDSFKVYKYMKSENQDENFSKFVATGCEEVNDFLVSLPGGILGRQAFCGFLENAIRNAAKHNLESGDGFLSVYMEVKEDKHIKGFYIARYYDNVSILTGGLIGRIRKKIDRPLIDQETGELTTGDWGIQEMRIYADFLAYPFISGKNQYAVHRRGNSCYRLWPEEQEINKGTRVLSYSFGLQKAKLILVVDDGRKSSHSEENVGVYFADFDESTLKSKIKSVSPQLLLFRIPCENEEKQKDILSFVTINHPKLPARILLGVEKSIFSNIMNVLQQKIENKEIPNNRVYICEMPDYPSEDEQAEWQKFIIDVFKEWVLKSSKENDFNLVVYFDRGKETFRAFERWQKLREDLRHFGIDFINVLLYASKEDSIESVDDRSDVTRKISVHGRWIFFDNHHKAEGHLRNEIPPSAFYQAIGHDSKIGINNFSIFDQLENVPLGFSGALFILHLVETSMMKILIIDDRIARHLVQVDDGIVKFESLDYSSLIYSNMLFTLSFNYNTNDRKWLIKGSGPKEFVFDTENLKEGVQIENGIAKNVVCTASPSNLAEISSFDVIVVHQGWLETQEEQKGLRARDFIKSLWKFSPRIVVTSGRGKPHNVPKENDMELCPFVEFSAVEKYAMRELSKYHLGKTLMSVT